MIGKPIIFYTHLKIEIYLKIVDCLKKLKISSDSQIFES